MTTEVAKQQTGIQLQNPPDQPISDESLSRYGKQLQFNDKFLKNANEVCKKVCNSLNTSDLKPTRFSVSESHVCQEGVEDTGVDIVAYVGKEEDLNRAKTLYNEKITQLGGQQVSMDNKGVLHFFLDNVKVNLGFSVSQGPTVAEHRKAVFKQTTQMDREGKLHKNQIEKVSVDLHDSMSEFMKKDMDDFDLSAQRLARAWRRTALAPWGSWFSPLDSMLVMRNVLSRERQRGGPLGMTSVMRQFLTDMSDIENMALTFPETSLYDWDTVPAWIQQERPLLLDPVNPWRNPFSGMDRSVFREIKNRAQQALNMFEEESSSMMPELFNVPPEAVARGA